MGTILALIVFFITIHDIYPYPVNDLDNDVTNADTNPPIQCPLGFTFNKTSSSCRSEWNTAGRSNGIEKLTILCPNGLAYDVVSKSCVVGIGPTRVIEVPINNSEPMICIFGFDFDPTDGDCHLTTNIAGKVDATDGTDLFIICPIGYIYTGSGKLCKKAGDRRYMIVAPVVCPSGSQPNSNGECKDIW